MIDGYRRYQRCRNIHDSDVEKLRVVTTPDIDTQISRVLENFENFKHIWSIGVNTRIWRMPENFEHI